jgi:hypothetical protein
MNRFALLLIPFLIGTTVSALAQELRAIAEDGRRVILSPDGKWRFDKSISPIAAPAADGGSPLKTAVSKFSVSFDANKWVLAPRKEGDEPNKRTFTHKTLPVRTMVIADEIPAMTAMIRPVILSNAKGAGASTTILQEGEVVRNGVSVGNIRFAASMNGLEFVFATNYYGDADGNIQVTCFTAQQLFHKYAGECEEFQAGLRVK